MERKEFLKSTAIGIGALSIIPMIYSCKTESKKEITNQSSNIEVKAADFTAVDGESYLVSSAAARAITLPTAVLGLQFWVKDSTGDCGTNNFTITRAGSESIEGVAANKTLQTDWGSWHFICDGTNWFMING